MVPERDDAPDTEIEVPGPAPVELTEDDAIGEDEPAESGQQARPGLPRDTKTGRWAKARAERNKDRAEANNWRQERESILSRLAAAEERANRPPPAAPAAPAAQPAAQQSPAQQKDPFDEAFADLDAALEAELQLLEKDPARSPKRYNELKRKETALVVRREQAQAMRGQPARREEANPREAEYQARHAVLSQEFPWLAGGTPQNNDMITATRNYRAYLIEGLKRPDTIVTDREALAHIAAQFGVGKRPAAPANGRSPYAAPATRPGASASNGRPQSVKVPAQLLGGSGLSKQALAQAMFEVDEES